MAASPRHKCNNLWQELFDGIQHVLPCKVVMMQAIVRSSILGVNIFLPELLQMNSLTALLPKERI